MNIRIITPLALMTLAACASATTPTGSNTYGTGGTGTTTGSSGSFSGSFTPAAAIYEGNAGGVDAGQYVINLLSEPMGCASWQDPNAGLSGQDLQVVLYGAGNGQYQLLDPNSQTQANNTGEAVDVTTSGSKVSAASGNVTLSAANAGGNLTGSMEVAWNDGETLTVPAFTATYCTDTNNFGGTFTPQAALFETDNGSTVALMFDQNVSCDDYASGNYPAGVTIWEVIIGGTTAGTYALADPNTATSGQGLAYQNFSNATVTSENGNVTLSSISSTSASIAVPTVTWSSTATSTMAAVTASYCDL